MKFRKLLCVGAAVSALTAGQANAANIVLVDQGFSGTPAQQAMFRAGFQIAAAYWGSVLTNNITIKLGVSTAALGAGIIATSANLLNLFDLRPGRALKAALLVSAALSVGPVPAPVRPLTAAVAGSAAAALGDDLAGRSMLGDTGANALGALLGVAVLARCGRRGRLLALAAVLALTGLSERVSFTAVIEATPGLRELDRLGRP